MALEPITRQEKIIAGQDLEPITRMEMFLKEYGGSGGGGGASSSEVFIIHATLDETYTNAQLDKTPEQIYEAYQSGKYCLVRLDGAFVPVTSVKTNGAKYLMSVTGFMFPTSEQGRAANFDLATSDGVTWAVNMITPSLYNVCCNGLQISGPGNQYYTISVDTNGNLTATAVT